MSAVLQGYGQTRRLDKPGGAHVAHGAPIAPTRAVSPACEVRMPLHDRQPKPLWIRILRLISGAWTRFLAAEAVDFRYLEH